MFRKEDVLHKLKNVLLAFKAAATFGNQDDTDLVYSVQEGTGIFVLKKVCQTFLSLPRHEQLMMSFSLPNLQNKK